MRWAEVEELSAGPLGARAWPSASVARWAAWLVGMMAVKMVSFEVDLMAGMMVVLTAVLTEKKKVECLAEKKANL